MVSVRVVVAILFLATIGRAQLPATIGDSSAFDIVAPPSALESWENDYENGRWDDLQRAVRSALAPAGFDFRTNYYFIAFRASSGDVIRFLAHDGVSRYSAVLPGVRTVYDVYVAPLPSTERVRIAYLLTPIADPVQKQALAFFKALDPGQLIDAVVSAKTIGPEPATLRATLTPVTLPLLRASIVVKTVVVQGSGKPSEAKHELVNMSLRRLGFGPVAAGTVSNSGDDRVKISGGRIVADPPGSGMALAAVYWHPRAYDPETLFPSRAERFRLLGGVVIKPEPGLAAGVSALLFRGVSINAGYAWMRVATLPAGASVGDEVRTPDPLDRGVGGAWWAGLGYVFE